MNHSANAIDFDFVSRSRVVRVRFKWYPPLPTVPSGEFTNWRVANAVSGEGSIGKMTFATARIPGGRVEGRAFARYVNSKVVAGFAR